ncbi:class I SAM-dependent methyltransferase [Amycolatopsis magusensis]|uniref:SAM-dependent methyltransferase n=1 Tax=Amycolatopsis magusensis TaxID=882444 RepID=A0ABS4PYS5_9PSEU|nr:class I SAM-dependent methyltransferase [Amycolatopsis magusensis]MBP2184582.1 SAM-dependent methyltransferase [Amycolatopsis magusensis]
MAPNELKPYWNTNVARHPDILRAVPAGCAHALDVGCGDGLLARKLAGRAEHVTGIDTSAEMIARARERLNATFVQADFLTADLPEPGYDFLCSVTAIHHMDFDAALTRMRELLKPGGTLVVVGLALDSTALDWARRIATAPAVKVVKLARRAHGPDGMPAAQATMTYGQVRTAAQRILPGVRYRWHVLRRYSLTWTKPLD